MLLRIDRGSNALKCDNEFSLRTLPGITPMRVITEIVVASETNVSSLHSRHPDNWPCAVGILRKVSLADYYPESVGGDLLSSSASDNSCGNHQYEIHQRDLGIALYELFKAF